MALLALAALVVASVVLLCYWFYRSWLVEPEGAPPLVKIDGSVFKAMKEYVRDPPAVLRYAKKTYGDVFTMYLGFFKMTIFTDMEAVDWIQRAPETELSFEMTSQTFLRAVVGWDAVKTRTLEENQEKMEKIGKALSGCMPHFFDVIKYETEKWAKEIAAKDKAVDWLHALDVLVMRINMRNFLGSSGPEGTPERFVELYDELETKGVTPSAMMLPDWWPWGNRARCAAIRAELTKVIRPMYLRRKKELEEHGQNPDDCAYMDEYILTPHFTGRPWSEEEVLERMRSTFVISRVNTVKTLFWTSISSAVRPAITQRLNELLQDMDITYNEVKGAQLRFIDNVLKETVRPMYPINIAVRGLKRPTRWKDYVVPKGYFVGGCPHLLNTDPEIFPDIDVFKPERWENAELNKKMWRFFGMGMHRCRGEQYALLTTRTAMSILFKDYTITWVDQKEPDKLPEYPTSVALPGPRNPVMVQLKPKTVEKD